MMQRIAKLIIVSRILSWPLVALLFLTGVAVSKAEITPLLLLDLMLASTLLPLVVFGVNDVFDYHSDSLNRRKRSIISGLPLRKEDHAFVLSAAALASAALLGFSLYRGNLTGVIAIALALAISWGYSMKGIRLKEIPVADSLSNAALFWAVILLGFSHGGTLQAFPTSIYFASLGAAAAHAIGAVMDYTPDKRAGLRTIATCFGKRLASLFAAAIMLLILLLSGIRNNYLLSIVYYAIAASLVIAAHPKEKLARYLALGGFLVTLLFIAAFLYQQFYK